MITEFEHDAFREFRSQFAGQFLDVHAIGWAEVDAVGVYFDDPGATRQQPVDHLLKNLPAFGGYRGGSLEVREMTMREAQLIYKTPDGTLRDRLLGRTDEDTISVATQERPWSFDGDGDAFKLGRGEAHRPRLPLRPDDGRPHVECGDAPASDHRGLRVHASASAASLRVGRRPRCRKNNHGRPLPFANS